MEKTIIKYINTKSSSKILAFIWAFIFCFTYCFMMYREKMLFNIAVPFHVCLLLPTILLTTVFVSNYNWVNTELYVLYHTFVHATQFWISIKLMNYMFNHPNGYMILFSELGGICVLLAYGGVAGALITLPFKFVQSFMFDIDMYNFDDSIPRTLPNDSTQFDLDLETKNETELQGLLKHFNADEKYEKSRKVQEILLRKFR